MCYAQVKRAGLSACHKQFPIIICGLSSTLGGDFAAASIESESNASRVSLAHPQQHPYPRPHPHPHPLTLPLPLAEATRRSAPSISGQVNLGNCRKGPQAEAEAAAAG